MGFRGRGPRRPHQLDVFPLAVGGVQTLWLTYFPIPGSVDVEWEGVPQVEGADWTLSQGFGVQLTAGALAGDQVSARYAHDNRPGALRRVTVQLIANDHADQLAVTFLLPDGTRYPVPGVNTPGAGPVVDFGNFPPDAMGCEFSDQTAGGTWTYGQAGAENYIHRDPIDGTDPDGTTWSGYRWTFDDAGGAGAGAKKDLDFNDVVMDVKGYAL